MLSRIVKNMLNRYVYFHFFIFHKLHDKYIRVYAYLSNVIRSLNFAHISDQLISFDMRPFLPSVTNNNMRARARTGLRRLWSSRVIFHRIRMRVGALRKKSWAEIFYQVDPAHLCRWASRWGILGVFLERESVCD